MNSIKSFLFNEQTFGVKVLISWIFPSIIPTLFGILLDADFTMISIVISAAIGFSTCYLYGFLTFVLSYAKENIRLHRGWYWMVLPLLSYVFFWWVCFFIFIGYFLSIFGISFKLSMGEFAGTFPRSDLRQFENKPIQDLRNSHRGRLERRVQGRGVTQEERELIAFILYFDTDPYRVCFNRLSPPTIGKLLQEKQSLKIAALRLVAAFHRMTKSDSEQLSTGL